LFISVKELYHSFSTKWAMKEEAITCGQTSGDPLSYHNYGTLYCYKIL